MAFQIIDDVLDYTSSNDGLGKPVLNDVKQGVYTLPLIYAMQKHQPEFQPLLEKQLDMSDADLENLLDLIEKYKGVEQAFMLADKYTKKALREITKLPVGAYRDQMYDLTSSILKRNI